MNYSKFNNFSIGLWSLVLVLFGSACNQLEIEEISNEFALPETVGFIKGIPTLSGDISSRLDFNQLKACGESKEFSLLAGQHINVGTVQVKNDETNVYITTSTVGSDWYMRGTHLIVGTTPATIGAGKTPSPGKFPYKTAYNSALQVVTYTFAKADLPTSFYFAFHAEMVRINENNGLILQTESAWANGQKFVSKGSWATFSGPYTIQECTIDQIEEEVVCYSSETAWAGNSKGNGSAWWYIFDASGSTVQNIYAGQKLTDGTITYSNGILTINLGSMKLQDVKEPVKIQGYQTSSPDTRPAAGQFTTYKGDQLVINVGAAKYFAIHLDVMVPTACPL
jgi:hypothetical protein